MKRELSAYTIARYCSDVTDVTHGIDEIWERIRERNRVNKRSPYYFYNRLSKLKKKLNKLTNKESKVMNYRCREIKSMIDKYESTSDVNKLINSLKRYIDEHGEIYEVAYISKADLAFWGYDTDKINDELLSRIALKMDIGDSVQSAVEYWARHYGIPKIEGKE